MIGYLLGCLYGIDLGTNVRNELGLSDGKVLGRELEDLVVI